MWPYNHFKLRTQLGRVLSYRMFVLRSGKSVGFSVTKAQIQVDRVIFKTNLNTHRSSTLLYKLQSPDVSQTRFRLAALPFEAVAFADAMMSVNIRPLMVTSDCGCIDVRSRPGMVGRLRSYACKTCACWLWSSWKCCGFVVRSVTGNFSKIWFVIFFVNWVWV